MTRPGQGINQAFAYRLLSPLLYIPWVWTQFFASAISWMFIAMYSVWTWNATIYYYPIWGMFIFFALCPFQESQQEIIKIIEIVVEGISGLLDDTIFPALEDMMYVIQPACWAHNFLWDGGLYIFKLALYNPVKLAMNILFPYNPYNFFKTITLSTGAFPVTTVIDTSSSPDWLVGPYDRSTKDNERNHPIMNTERLIQGDDETVHALARWSRQHNPEGRVKFAVNMEELEGWTDPEVPEYYRRSLSRRILRRVMDRDLGLEEPSWWENVRNNNNNDKPSKPSAWARVFNVGYQGAGWRGLGMVRMDHPPELPEYAKAKGRSVPPGSVAYRVLADDKGTRDLNFAIFQSIAEVLNIFLDAVAQILVQLWNITLVIGMNLFDDIENFFTNAFSFVANIFNQIWKEFLNLPCLKFDSVEVFAISLLDCICQPLTQAIIDLGGLKMDRWFNYERPNGIGGIPQAILGCVGLGCVDINLLITKPNAFVTGLVGDCMGLPDIAVCCIVDIPNCIQSIIISLTDCPCAGGGSVDAPDCKFGIEDGTDWFKCILIFFSNQVLRKLGGQASTNCNINTCPSLSGVASGIINCIAATLLDLDFFVDTLGNLFDIDIGCNKKKPWECLRRRRRFIVAETDSLRGDTKDDMYGPVDPAALLTGSTVSIDMFPEDKLDQDPQNEARGSIWASGGPGPAPVLSSRFSDIYQTEAYRNKTKARYDAMLITLRSYQQNRLVRYEDVSLIKQLSHAMNPQSRSRHRALLQAQVDRHIYSNPAIGVATNRFTEILRDLIDFAEFRTYGPDPFTMPPDDADPSKDPRTASAPRYVDQSASHNHAYLMHSQAVADNPYYAGLYKLLFQMGDVSNISSGNTDNDAAWKAMGGHGGNPLFHIGRIMATSRQILFAYGQIFTEVWWDTNTYSFHFPNHAQIARIVVQTRVPLYLDDLRSAVGGLLGVHSEAATAYLHSRAAEFAEHGEPADATADDVTDKYGEIVRNYAGIVQAEVAIRTVVTRLLVPDKVEAMLDELSTRSAVHAHYSQRMKRRVIQHRENSLHDQRSLTSQIEAWRRKHHGSNAGVHGDGHSGLGNTNRVIIDLDPVAHPHAGNLTLQQNQRVRFADGLEGTFVGTVGSMVHFSPTRSLGMRAHPVMVIIGAVKDVIMFIVDHWQLIATALATIMMTPWGRVIWESYVLFIYNSVIVPLFTHGLFQTFTDVNYLIDLTIDFIILTDTIIFFLMNEIARYVGCYGWSITLFIIVYPIVMILDIISIQMLKPLMLPLWWIFIIILILFPYCPPEQKIENNHITQAGPWKYFDDLIECFADEISGPAKDAYNGICSVSADCKGAAPCICENKGGQYNSVFMSFKDDTRCGTAQAPTGQCLCWPKLDCQFLFFRIGSGDKLFADNCEDLGYELEIAWYQPASYYQIFVNLYYNFWISTKYITRTLTRSPGMPSLLFPIIFAIGMLLFFYISFATGIIVISLLAGYTYGLPLWKDLVIKIIIPSLELAFGGIPLVSYLSNYAMSFLRFPNFTDGQPLGFNRDGEGTCFIFNLPTFFGGAAVNFWYWAVILAIAWYGLGSILWFIFNNIMVPIRVVAAPVWLFRQRGRLDRHYDTAKNLLKSAVPSWLRNRGAGNVGSALWNTAKSVGSALEPKAPNTGLNRWISHYYPNPYHSMQAIMNPQGTNPYMMTPGRPVHIDGRGQASPHDSVRRMSRRPEEEEENKKET